MQSVDYDVPYLRGQASKFHQQIQDLERKHADCLKNAAACAANYKKVGPMLVVSRVCVGRVWKVSGVVLGAGECYRPWWEQLSTRCD